MRDQTDSADSSLTLKKLSPLLIVYVVWGCTYLAIRIAVREGSGFPPFILAASRYLPAAIILLVASALRRQRMRPTRQEWVTLILSGVLMLGGGNGLVTWSEQHADSSLAALLVAAVPIWAMLIEATVTRRRPSAQLVSAILVGFGGIALLALPGMTSGVRADVLSILALLTAGFSWALGSFLQSRKPVGLDPIVSAGYQMLTGGLALLAISLVSGEPRPTPSTEAWLAWLFLMLFGSVITHTAYIISLKTLPIQIAVTYTYVNSSGSGIRAGVLRNRKQAPRRSFSSGKLLLGVVLHPL
ncbi:MAG: EamA family transporter [Anaerolineales bacterium]